MTTRLVDDGYDEVNLNINLGTIKEDEEDEEDSNYEGDEVSEVSMDEYSFDTVTTAHQSTAFKDKKIMKEISAINGEHFELPKSKERIHGNTKIGLPYLLDLWRDCCSHARISVQVQLLSGRDAYKKVFVRVSTDCKELVLTLPMSPYMSRSDLAFNTFLLAENNSISDTEKHYLKILLKHHPKAASRMVAVSKVKGRSYTDGFFYEQRIKLPRKVQHEFATQQSGDDLFTGKKFIEYPDGSVFLHVELVAEVKDNYIPEERMLDPKYMKSVPKTTGAAPMETEPTGDGARVLPNDQTANTTGSIPPANNKRAREGEPAVETVSGEDSDNDDEDDGMSQMTGPNAAAAAAASQAEAKAFQEAARNNGAKVLNQWNQHEQEQAGGSSLQQAAAKGAAAAAGSKAD